jgi:ribonuclease HI
MDGHPTPPSSGSSGTVDNVLRWIPHEDRSRAGLLLISPLSVHMRYIIRIHFAASNNVVEYEALVNGLKITIELGVRCLNVRGDS